MTDQVSNPAVYEGYVGRWSQQVANEFVPWFEPDLA